jgi:hypothetical protein
MSVSSVSSTRGFTAANRNVIRQPLTETIGNLNLRVSVAQFGRLRQSAASDGNSWTRIGRRLRPWVAAAAAAAVALSSPRTMISVAATFVLSTGDQGSVRASQQLRDFNRRTSAAKRFQCRHRRRHVTCCRSTW